ncbi:MAG: hypothetical protein H6Q86_289 [candidate division NC10 bacterium]|nr:hypothetical protein [candidate division NC10 bacterium]
MGEGLYRTPEVGIVILPANLPCAPLSIVSGSASALTGRYPELADVRISPFPV